MYKALFNPITGVYRCAVNLNDEDHDQQMQNALSIFKDNKADDFVEISDEDFQKYMLGTTGGDNGTGYIRDPATGQCVSAPPRIYSTEEKLTLIQADFNNQLNNLKSDMSLAQLTANNDEVARLQNSYSTLVETSNNAVIDILTNE